MNKRRWFYMYIVNIKKQLLSYVQRVCSPSHNYKSDLDYLRRSSGHSPVMTMCIIPVFRVLKQLWF